MKSKQDALERAESKVSDNNDRFIIEQIKIDLERYNKLLSLLLQEQRDKIDSIHFLSQCNNEVAKKKLEINIAISEFITHVLQQMTKKEGE